jgi:hypothetical protein
MGMMEGTVSRQCVSRDQQPSSDFAVSMLAAGQTLHNPS